MKILVFSLIFFLSLRFSKFPGISIFLYKRTYNLKIIFFIILILSWIQSLCEYGLVLIQSFSLVLEKNFSKERGNFYLDFHTWHFFICNENLLDCNYYTCYYHSVPSCQDCLSSLTFKGLEKLYSFGFQLILGNFLNC